MAIAGTFRASQSGPIPYSGALKQGTGINAIHAVDTGDVTWKRVTPNPDGAGVPSQELSDETVTDGSYGYTIEDSTSTLYGDGTETGTADHPDWTDNNAAERAATPRKFPSWGRRRAGIPGGWHIRSENHGGNIASTSKTDYRRSAQAGRENKTAYGDVLDSDISPESYDMQTSMRQRDTTRAGSPRSGSQSLQNAGIREDFSGPRKPSYSGGYRHDEMLPKEQAVILRPFFVRTAGVGPVGWMGPNDMYVANPRARVVPGAPYAGPDAGGNPDSYVAGANIHGYTDEDVVY